MKFIYGERELTLEFRENEVQVITIENREYFSAFLQNLYNQSQGSEGDIILSEGEKILSLNKVAEIVWNPFSVDINNKKILGKLFQKWCKTLSRKGNREKMIEFGKLEYYLLVVNAIGALAYLINLLLYRHTANGRIDVIVTMVSLLGGSAGMLLMILLFDRKAEKENMMSRVFIICIFIIQVIMLLIFKGHHAEHFTFAFWKFFAEHRILLIYLGIMNLVTFIVFAIDKVNARANRSRIKIVTLLGLSFAGGSVGGLISMYLFRHKTQKDYFTVGMPLIIVMQVVVLFYVMNAGW